MQLGPVCGYAERGLAWFRIFGLGLHFKDTRRHALTFSERGGHVKRIIIGPWSVRVLWPGDGPKIIDEVLRDRIDQVTP